MALYHVKSNTVADFTGTVTGFNSQGSTTTLAATNLVRPADWNSAHMMAGTISGNTSGQSTYSGATNVVFQGGNNVTLSLATAASAATVVISAGAGAAYTKTFWYPYNEAVNVAGLHGQASMVFNPLPLEDALSVDRVVMPLYFSNSSNSTGTMSASIWFGIYTKNGNTLSLYASTSNSISLGYAGNNSSASQRGIRLMTTPWTTTLPQSRYYVGVGIRSTTGGNNCTFSQMLVSQLNSNVSGMWDAGSNRSVQWPIGVGYYSASTTAIPGSVAISQIDGTNSLAARPPSWHMINGTV